MKDLWHSGKVTTLLIAGTLIAFAVLVTLGLSYLRLNVLDRRVEPPVPSDAPSTPEQRSLHAIQMMPLKLPVYVILDINRALHDAPSCENLDMQCRDDDLSDMMNLIMPIANELTIEYGISMRDDVLPWAEGSVTLGIEELEISMLGEISNASWVLAVQTADPHATDLFMNKLGLALHSRAEGEMERRSYRGVEITAWGTKDHDDFISYARAGSFALLASRQEYVETAIDTWDGISAVDPKIYWSLIEELPATRELAIFVDGAKIGDFLRGLSGRENIFGLMPRGMSSFARMAIAISSTDDGLQIDVVADYRGLELGSDQIEMLAASAVPARTADIMPKETFFYYSGRRLDLIWDSLRDGLGQNNNVAEFAELTDLVGSEFGIDLEIDLFDYLAGEWALAGIPSRGAASDQQASTPELIFLAEIKDSERLKEVAQNLGAIIEAKQISKVAVVEERDLLIYELTPLGANEVKSVYGFAPGYLFIASSRSPVDLVFHGDETLAESESYKYIWQTFTTEMQPRLFLDLEKLRIAQSSSSPNPNGSELVNLGGYLGTVERIAAATEPLDEGIARATIVVLFADETPNK